MASTVHIVLSNNLRKALTSRPPETFGEKQANQMMTAGKVSLPSKSPNSSGGIFCPSCGSHHKAGTLCGNKSVGEVLDMLKGASGVTMSGNKKGNPAHDSSTGQFTSVPEAPKAGSEISDVDPKADTKLSLTPPSFADNTKEATSKLAKPSSDETDDFVVAKPGQPTSRPEKDTMIEPKKAGLIPGLPVTPVQSEEEWNNKQRPLLDLMGAPATDEKQSTPPGAPRGAYVPKASPKVADLATDGKGTVVGMKKPPTPEKQVTAGATQISGPPANMGPPNTVVTGPPTGMPGPGVTQTVTPTSNSASSTWTHPGTSDITGMPATPGGPVQVPLPGKGPAGQGKPFTPLPFSQMYGAGASMGSGLGSPGGTVAPTAGFVAQRTHAMLNPMLNPALGRGTAGPNLPQRTPVTKSMTNLQNWLAINAR